MSRNFKLYCVYIISLISFVLFATNGLTNAQPNLTTANSLFNNQQTPASTPSSSITETVNEVLSGSIDGMIGDTVDMLSSDTASLGEDSGKSSLEEELPSSLTLGRNNQTITQDIPIETRIDASASNNTQNISNQMQPNNESAPDSVDEIKQSFQRSMYNSTIVQSLDNNSFTKLVNQNTFDDLIYKMKNILDIDLFK